MTAIAQGCRNLTKLAVGNCQRVTDHGIVAIAQGCPNLASLDVGGCNNVTDDGIVAIANGCRNLTKLDVWCCNHVTNSGIVAVAQSCPNLATLSVSGCQQVTQATVGAFRLGPVLARFATVVCADSSEVVAMALRPAFSVELDPNNRLLRSLIWQKAQIFLVLGSQTWLEPCAVGDVALGEVVLSDADCTEALAQCIEDRLALHRVFTRAVLGSTLRNHWGNSDCKLWLLGGGGVQSTARKLVAGFLDVPIESEPANLRAVLAALPRQATTFPFFDEDPIFGELLISPNDTLAADDAGSVR